MSNIKCVKNWGLIFLIFITLNIRNVSIFRTIRDFQRQNVITDYSITTDNPPIHASNKIS